MPVNMNGIPNASFAGLSDRSTKCSEDSSRDALEQTSVYVSYLAAKAGNLISITINDNQLPILKMLLMPVFVLTCSVVRVIGAQIATGDLVECHATGAFVD